MAKKKKKLKEIFSRVNIVRLVCDNVLGENHTHGHRMTVGVFVMACGVVIAKSVQNIHFELVHYVADGIGYMIHGLGVIPFAEYAQAKLRNDENTMQGEIDVIKRELENQPNHEGDN